VPALAYSNANILRTIPYADDFNRVPTSQFHILDHRPVAKGSLLRITDQHGRDDADSIANDDYRSQATVDGNFHAYFNGLDIFKLALRAAVVLVFI
jgi:hypothetical protein